MPSYMGGGGQENGGYTTCKAYSNLATILTKDHHHYENNPICARSSEKAISS